MLNLLGSLRQEQQRDGYDLASDHQRRREASRRGLKTDQLYWTGTKEIGIYAERATQKKFTFLKNKILATGAQINQDGDTDSTFFATQEQALEIARLLGCAKNSVSKETRDKMSRLFKERMNYND